MSKRLDDVILENGVNEIFLMNIDTEGKDLEIISSYSWSVRPVFLMIENFDIMLNRPEKEIELFMSKMGYREVARTYLTSIFVDTSHELSFFI